MRPSTSNYYSLVFVIYTALEDEYERKRWDRKFRKYRGRPKKRSKREVGFDVFTCL